MSLGGKLGWWRAHSELALWGLLLPLLWGLQHHAAWRFLGRGVDASTQRSQAAIAGTGAVLVTVGTLLQPSGLFAVAAMVGAVAITVAAILQTKHLLPVLPKRKESVVDVAQDPLTKGDDACFAQLRFSLFLLPVGMLLWLATWWPGIANGAVWWPRLHAAGLHMVLAGHGLFTVYALAHLWVPRFSGVPAIAAGAIKGELHSGLLGVTGITLAFLLPAPWSRGVLVGLGPFLFLSFFTFMGVIGANIMRNKSQTHRVTPVFAYVPWTFTAVWWLVAAVLLGLFLAIVPDALIEWMPRLRLVHIHMALLGGVIQMAIALMLRALPEAAGAAPPPFSRHKAAFLLFNGGFSVLLLAWLAGLEVAWQLGGSAAMAVGLALVIVLLRQWLPNGPDGAPKTSSSESSP